MEAVEIEAGTLAQVHRTRTGKTIVVDDDVQGVAAELRAIDPGLRLTYHPDADVWVVHHCRTAPDGSVEEHLVTTAQACDQRIVARIREINQPDYDYGAELERINVEADRRADYDRREQIGPHGERLAFALSRDLGRHESPRTRSSRAVIPREL